MNNYQEYINEKLTKREILEQLAEEASELSQASLKLIRSMGYSNNTTPVTKANALKNLCEEFEDAQLCLLMYLDLDVNEEDFPKLKRWAERLGFKDE